VGTAPTSVTAATSSEELARALANPRPLPAPGAPWRSEQIVGCLIGERWLVTKLLGEGGWGAVFKAHDKDQLDRVSAVKVPKLGDRQGEGEKLGRFRQEIDSVLRIHAAGAAPHVVRALDSDPEGTPFPWLALEYVEGGDLGEDLKKRRKFPPREGLTLALAALQGVIEAHRAGVIHRDLKPANVMRNYAGEVRLTDFGVARMVKREGEKVTVGNFGLTVTGQQVGSVHFMSPEAINSETVDKPADLYSFGAMLYNMLAGRPPFRGSMLQIYQAHLMETAEPVSHLVMGVPAVLDELILELLVKKPEERPTAEETQARLREALAALDQEPEAKVEDTAPVAVELSEDDEIVDAKTGEEYVVEKELGRGGMGIVYAVTRSRDEERLALKVAGFAYANQAQAGEQLVRDAENAIRVSRNQPHDAVAKVFGHGRAVVKGVPILFLISEIVEGLGLDDLIRRWGFVDEKSALDLWIPVAEGLAAIHDAGIMHLDMSPGNILLQGEFQEDEDLAAQVARAHPKIVDFGISKRVEAQTIRAVEGNPNYMSPEQCQGLPPTFATDVYMLGATFYHATTGRPLFSGDDAMVVMNQHRTALPRFADLETVVGHDLALVIHKCLCKSPDDRYQSVAELVEDLKLVGDSKFPRSQLKLSWEREKRKVETIGQFPWRLVLSLVAVFLVLAGAGVTYAIDQQNKVVVQAEQDKERDLLAQAIGSAGPEQVADLHGQITALEHYEGSARETLRGSLRGRVQSLLQDLSADVRGEAQAVSDRPDSVTFKLDDLSAQHAELLAATNAAPELFESLTVNSPDQEGVPYTDQLAHVAAEIDLLSSLCQVSKALEKTDWDQARAHLQQLELWEPGPEPASIGQPVASPALGLPALHPLQGELCKRWRSGVKTLTDDWGPLEERTTPLLEQKQFAAVREALDEFREQHGSYARYEPTATAFAALSTRLQEAINENPFENLANEQYQTVLTAEEREALEGYLAGSTPTGPGLLEARDLVNNAMAKLTEFQQVDLRHEGRTQKVELTQLGQWLQGFQGDLLACYTTWALAAWARVTAALEELWAATPERPQDFLRLKSTLAGFAHEWTACDRVAISTPEGRRLEDVSRAAGERIDAQQGVAIAGFVAHAATAVRDYDLDLARERLELLRAFDGDPTYQRYAEQARLIEDQIQALEELDRELVLVDVPEDYVLGREGETTPSRRPRPLTDPAAGTVLQVDAHEMRVRHYEVFLREVARLDRDHKRVLGCHPDEPRTNHQPPDWSAQAAHPERPVVNVSWYDAYACARWAGRRLLARDEWELCARGSDPQEDQRFDRWRAGARAVAGWSAEAPLAVGAAQEQSAFGGGASGVFDTAGNVSEWTHTPWGTRGGKYYHSGPHFRHFGTEYSPEVHDLFRHNFRDADQREDFLGFRCVRAAD
jgi:serine/threonine protein kinase